MTTITLSNVTLTGWQGGTTAELRIYADQSFRASDGTLVEAGGIGYGFWKTFSCTVAGTSITITGSTLQSTVDSDVAGARYSAYFHVPATGALILPFDGFIGFSLPATPTTNTWEGIRVYNQAAIPMPLNELTYSRDTINSLIANAGGMMVGGSSLVEIANGGTGSTTAAAARTALSAAKSGANSDITSLSGLTTAITIAQGGTGATSASAARTALGVAASGANNDITALSALSTALVVAQGGTGRATLTSNALLYGNGTGTVSLLTPSTGVLIASGGAPSWNTSPSLAGLSLSGNLLLSAGNISVTSGTLTLGALTQNSIPYIGASGVVSQSNTNFAFTGTVMTLYHTLKFPADSGGGSVAFKAPASTTANAAFVYILPTTNGTTNGDVLSIMDRTSGQLAWVAPGGAASSGVDSVNSLVGALTIVAGSATTDFTISQPTATSISINVPDAGTGVSRGLLTNAAQSIAGVKTLTATMIHRASSASASTAPIKFQSSTLMTTPEAFAFENDNTRPYYTNSSAARKSIAFLDDNITGNAATATLAATFSGALTGAVTSSGMATSYSQTVPINKGGTNLTSYVLGDILYASATNTLATLAGATVAAKRFLTQTGTGAVSAAPVWNTIVAGDLPSIENLNASTGLPVAKGGTGSTTASAARTALGTAALGANSDITSLSGLTTALSVAQGGTGQITVQAAINAFLAASGALVTGDLFYYNGTNIVRRAIGTASDVLTVVAGLPAWAPPSGGGGASGVTGITGRDDVYVSSSTGSVTLGSKTMGDTAESPATESGGAYHIIPGLIGSTGNCAGTANQLRVFRFYLPMRLSVTQVCFYSAASVVGQTVQTGIYDAAGNLLISSGSFAGSTGEKTATIAATILTPGFYYLAWVYSVSTSSTLQGITTVNANLMDILNDDTVQLGTAANAQVGTTMPATLGTVTAISVAAPIPIVKLQS